MRAIGGIREGMSPIGMTRGAEATIDPRRGESCDAIRRLRREMGPRNKASRAHLED